MTLYEFNLLEEDQKYDITFTNGQFLTYHLTENKRYALYAIDKFFVEVTYLINHNKIIALNSFKTGKLLDKYSNLDKI
ncbi:hypothetical protein [Mesonia sp. K7]|uniref:hypothetical protein n=1 Tax=Mesonia sp. K7 TaxID=2218606 RepID=UPI000DA8A8A3|nr:hypothetical protein [Mesonia sp. K7]PZD76448.1 hypothetical protein DNG35_12020 [Mesonia sp. K7]